MGIELATESLTPGSRRPAVINKEKAQSVGAFWYYSNYAGGVNPYKGMDMQLLYRLTGSNLTKHLYGATEAGFKGYIPFSNRFVGFLEWKSETWKTEMRNFGNNIRWVATELCVAIMKTN